MSQPETTTADDDNPLGLPLGMQIQVDRHSLVFLKMLAECLDDEPPDVGSPDDYASADHLALVAYRRLSWERQRDAFTGVVGRRLAELALMVYTLKQREADALLEATK